MLQISMTFEYQLESPMGIHGSLWLYGAVSLLGFFFVLFFVKESSKLTDIEMKQLFWPKDKELTKTTQQETKIQKVVPILAADV